MDALVVGNATASVPVTGPRAALALALAVGALGLESAYGRGAGDGERSASETARTVVLAVAAGVGGYLAIVLWFLLLGSLVQGLLGEMTLLQRTGVLQASNGLGTLTGVALYLAVTDRGPDFLDLRRPTRRDAGYVVAGLVFIFGTFLALNYLLTALGVEGSSHGTSETLRNAADPTTLAALYVVTSVLVIGPGEELLYRNVVQKALYDVASRPVAILGASVVFAAVHFTAYSSGTTAQVLVSLAVVFGLSLTLGAVYERTDSVVVPAAVHGLFNASQFAILTYEEVTAGAVDAVAALLAVLPAGVLVV